MNDRDKTQLGKTLWGIADDLRGAMNADDFRDYMLSFLFLRYLSDNYEAAAQKELGRDYPNVEDDDRRVLFPRCLSRDDRGSRCGDDGVPAPCRAAVAALAADDAPAGRG